MICSVAEPFTIILEKEVFTMKKEQEVSDGKKKDVRV